MSDYGRWVVKEGTPHEQVVEDVRLDVAPGGWLRLVDREGHPVWDEHGAWSSMRRLA